MNEKNLLTEDKINEIRASVDIVDVISSYIPLTGKGKNFFGVCPFHDDHSPSMSVSRDRQIYKCFSCGAGGNVLTFVRDYENISFIEAVKKLADKAGIFLDVNVGAKRENPALIKYYEIYDLAEKLYTNNINTIEGKKAIEYLTKRGLTKEIIKKFKIGLSLKNNNLLTGLLDKKGYSKSDIAKTGLVVDNHDIYYNRIMFPLFDLNGKTVAFSGRIYSGEDTSKYINTMETEAFKKGELLYNYHSAKNIARMKDKIIVVEGFMDAIRLYTIGYENVVATMGTAVTKEQVRLIKKMAKEVILMFDGDEAGLKAAYTASGMLNQSGTNAKIVVLEDNLDPDEYILKYGREKMDSKLSHPIDMMEFRMFYLKRNKDIMQAEGKANYVNEIIKELNNIYDPVLKEATVLKVAEETGFDISFIKSQLNQTEEVKEEKKEVQPKPSTRETKYEKAEKRLLFYMLNHEDIIKVYEKKVKSLITKKYKLLAFEIDAFYKNKGYISEADMISNLINVPDLKATLDEIMALDIEDTYTDELINDYIDTIEEGKMLNQIKYLKNEMKKTSDEETKRQLALDIVEIKKQMEKEEV